MTTDVDRNGGALIMAVSMGVFPEVKGKEAERIRELYLAIANTPRKKSDSYKRAKRLRECLASMEKK